MKVLRLSIISAEPNQSVQHRAGRAAFTDTDKKSLFRESRSKSLYAEKKIHHEQIKAKRDKYTQSF